MFSLSIIWTKTKGGNGPCLSYHGVLCMGHLLCRSSRLLSFPCAGLESRVFPVVLISMLADKLNMSPEEAERWIVNLIRNARLDAKIDSKLVRPSNLFIRRLHTCDLSIGKIHAALCKVKVALRGFKPPFVS